MTAVPLTNIGPFFMGFPIVLRTTPTFQSGAAFGSLDGMFLSCQITKGSATISGTATVTGGDVTLLFPPDNVTLGRWRGELSYQSDLMARFEFEVEQ